MYTCVGNQVSRNSPQVLDQAPFMEKVKSHHLDALMWMMRRAELCFEQIADHQVISHIHHARSLVPFKTMSGSKYYGGMAFGCCNVSLWCHTDSDFTMSISQAFIWGWWWSCGLFLFSNFGSGCTSATRWFFDVWCIDSTLHIISMQIWWQYYVCVNIFEDGSCRNEQQHHQSHKCTERCSKQIYIMS